jgi:hypothetical protein
VFEFNPFIGDEFNYLNNRGIYWLQRFGNLFGIARNTMFKRI